MNSRRFMPCFEAEGAQGGGGNGNVQSESGTQSAQTPDTPAIDYAKIQQMLDGTLAAKEDTALKAYFKQQGLSQQEAEQAMAEFKQQKAANQPDVGALQTQLTQAQLQAQKAQIESAATIASVELGIDAKSIQYILKMADFSQIMEQDGKINEDTLKESINKVLEDVPALKPQTESVTGFRKVGAGGNPSQQPQQAAQTQQTVPTKRWNRFN